MATTKNTAPQQILFIVNPIAGSRAWQKQGLRQMLSQQLAPHIKPEILVWERPGQHEEIIRYIKESAHPTVVALGGDGTINMVAQAVHACGKTLGIIPLGSGNGLARDLGIPLKPEGAIALLNRGHTRLIDTANVNGRFFACTSGAGFDAEVGEAFARSGSRGFSTYFKETVKLLRSYRPQPYVLEINGQQIKRDAFLVTVANASQYGNNVYIAPQASMDDGLLDICILKPFRWWQAPGTARRLFARSIQGSPIYESWQTQSLRLTRLAPAAVHYDGEPETLEAELLFEVNRERLRVVV